MQGFVSNRDSEKNEDKADPLEIVLYAVFVATSARASVGELADILQVGSISQQTSPTSRKPAYCHTPFHCTSSKDACIQLNMRPIKQLSLFHASWLSLLERWGKLRAEEGSERSFLNVLPGV